MSANRSVQAAQRRRAGPPLEQRGPATSINSAQMFSQSSNNNMRGNNIPSGKLAGQHASYMQQSYMSQKMDSQQEQPQNGISTINKLTIAQAITLITLRLGKLETYIQKGDDINEYGMNEKLEDDVVQNIFSRLESIENRSTPGTFPELTLLKQSVDNIKPFVSNTKIIVGNIVKEITEFKKTVDTLKDEITQLKELFLSLQSIVIENSQQINQSYSNNDYLYDNLTIDNLNIDNALSLDASDNEIILSSSDICSENDENDENTVLFDENDNLENNEIVGNNLKKMIEDELNESS